MLIDDRFQSSIEAEQEERWLPMQILAAVANTPTLPEETQVEVMKVCFCLSPHVLATKLCLTILPCGEQKDTQTGLGRLVYRSCFIWHLV